MTSCDVASNVCQVVMTGGGRWENDGLYLMMDDPSSAMERARARTAAIVRRRTDPVRVSEPKKGTPDIKFHLGEDGPDEALTERATRAKYDEIGFVASMCGGDDAAAVAGGGSGEGTFASLLAGDGCYSTLDGMVGRCRLRVSKPVLKRVWFHRLKL
jgi:hypothetical protein